MDNRRIGSALRQWTGNAIRRTSPTERKKHLAAVKYLSSIKGQPFPTIAYRALAVDPSKLKSWSDLAKFLKSDLPESYSATLKGAQRFIKDAIVVSRQQRALILSVRVEPKDWLFNVPYLTKQLPKAERTKEDLAGFGLSSYVGQQEVVAAPGSLARAFRQGRVELAAYEGDRDELRVVTGSLKLFHLNAASRILSVFNELPS